MRQLWLLCSLLLLTLSVGAKELQLNVLLLPLSTAGSFSPVDEDQLTRQLEQQLHSMQPESQLQLARSAELSAFQYPAHSDQPPTLSQAAQMCQTYGSRQLCWVSLHFHPEYDASSGHLVIAGAARVWVYHSEQRQVVLDQPLALVEQGQVKDLDHEEACRKLADELTQRCLRDLAIQLVALAEQRVERAQQHATQWSAPQAQPQHTHDYQMMLHAIHDYQRASKNQSHIDITNSEQNMVHFWSLLNAQEQQEIAKLCPGIQRLMTARPYYGSWRYYYRRRPFDY